MALFFLCSCCILDVCFFSIGLLLSSFAFSLHQFPSTALLSECGITHSWLDFNQESLHLGIIATMAADQMIICALAIWLAGTISWGIHGHCVEHFLHSCPLPALQVCQCTASAHLCEPLCYLLRWEAMLQVHIASIQIAIP